MQLSKIKSLLYALRIDGRDIFVAILAVITLLATIPIITYVYFASDLTSKERIMNRNDTGLILYDSSNNPFFTFYKAKPKVFVSIQSVPTLTQEAFIASEDKDFYYHPGFSISSIARSLFWDIKAKDISYGGSTITQQLVKNSLLNSNKNFLRKFQEVILANEIERRYNKKEILEMYVNSVYFGQGAFGIEEAAKTYFNMSAASLDLSQSSLLVGILPSPSTLSPISGDKQSAKQRQLIVLQKMYEQGYITLGQKQKAEKQSLAYNRQTEDLNVIAPHFALMVKDELIKKYGEETVSRSGFKVYTTLDSNWQKFAEKTVYNHSQALIANNANNASAVVMDPKTGYIKALVGSKDWYNDSFGKMNMATSPRQPGSAFKPIIYEAAFENHVITPATILHDTPITYQFYGQTYSPRDYDKKFRGNVTARRALANSLNVPSVEVMNMVGVPAGLEMAQRLGVTTLKDPSNYGLSLVLGAAEVPLIEMTGVYSIFANEGKQNVPTSILKVVDKDSNTIYSYESLNQQVVDPKYTFLISSILSDNNASAEVFGNALTISRPAAVKTGTTEDYKDAWTIGYTPSLVVGVWVGNNDRETMDNIAGSLGAAPIWKELMEKFLAQTPVEIFNPPPGITRTLNCNGQTATTSATFEYFVQGTQSENCVLISPSPTSGQTPPPTQQPTPTPIPTIQQAPTSTPTPTQPTIPTVTPLPSPTVSKIGAAENHVSYPTSTPTPFYSTPTPQPTTSVAP